MSCEIYIPQSNTFFNMESIEYQPKSDREKVIKIFDAIFAEADEVGGRYKGGYATAQLEKWLAQRMGIKSKLICDDLMAASLPLYSNDAHILSNPFWFGYTIDDKQDKWKKESDGKKGWVDNRTSTVGGIYSTYEHPFYMNFHVLRSIGLTSTECAAIYLHECGHPYTFYEYADRLSTANQVLEQVAKEVNGKRADRADHIFKLVSDVHKEVNPKDIDLLLGEDRVVAGNAYQSLVMGTLTSCLRDIRYAETSSEQLADSFAVRWGFGRELVTALDKISVAFGMPAKSNFTLWIINIVQLALTVVYSAAVAIALPMPVAAPAAALIALLFVVLFDENNAYRTYDNLKDRLKRIRNDVVGSLKNKRLPKEEVQEALKSLDEIDAVLSKTGTGESIITRLSSFLLPWSRRSVSDREKQQLLEELANNEFFVISQRFKNN